MTATRRTRPPVKLCGRPRNRDGQPCTKPVVRGATVCSAHGGKAPQVRRKALVRAEVMDWGLDAPEVDPGETMLRLLAQSAVRVGRYGALLQAAYQAADAGAEDFAGMPAGTRALIGLRYAATMSGGRVEVGEAIRGLAELEARERDRCMHFADLCRAGGLDERKVRIAERQIDTLELVLRAALERAGLGDADRLRVLDAVPVVLGELVGGTG